MPTTSNFGWTTPADTDLVKDGAAAIRTLGNGIDTSLVDLKGGTTGQVLAKATNTDLDFTWVAQDDSNAIQNAIVDAKGDLITATAADTPARLAVGTNGQILVANSSTSTGLEWQTVSSGAFTSLATGTLSGTEVSITSISGSYQQLFLVVSGVTASANNPMNVRINNRTNSDYRLTSMSAGAGAVTGYTTKDAIPFPAEENISTSSTNVMASLLIDQYALTGYKSYLLTFSSSALGAAAFGVGYANVTAAVTSLQIRLDGTKTFTAGTYTLYGVK